MAKKTLFYHLNDYAPSGLEFAEIKMKLVEFIDKPELITIHDVSIPSLDTMALGFVTGQLALSPFSHRMVIYGNCAPRRSSDKAAKNNVDHGIVYAKLKNGVEIVNVYSKYAFGFVKKEIEKIYTLKVPNKGSQFRSRDFFPEAVAKIINGDYSDLGEEISLDDIPEIANNLVAWTDGFGNIKTTMRLSDLKKQKLEPGDKVKVTLNGESMIGVVSIGGFQVDRGVLAINAGSSGQDDSFIEFFLRVHQISEKTAAVRFNYPVGGESFTLERV